MKHAKLVSALIFFILLLSSFIPIPVAVTVTPDVEFVVGNVTYRVNQTMEFHTIIISESYIVFDTTGFYISSPNDLDITLVYLRENITNADIGDKLLEFYANTTSGNVWFNLSGFLDGAEYVVNRDNVPVRILKANSSSFLSCNTISWSEHLFEIFLKEKPTSSEPFYYWYPPSNSFGIGVIKTLNTSYFENWTRDYFNVSLKASPTNVTWFDANEGLTEVWNWTHDENGTRAKISWIINTSTAPTDLFYKLIVGIDARAKNFINGTISNHSVSFDVPVAGTNETFSLFLNWSDIIPLIQDGKVFVKRGLKHVENNSYFYAVIQSVNKIPVGFVFEIDPTFGETSPFTGESSVDIEDRLSSGYHQAPSSGTVDNITVWLQDWDTNDRVKCFIQNSTAHLINETEERNEGGDDGWHTYDFDDGFEPTIILDEYYYIGATSGDSVRIARSNTGNNYYYDDDEYDDGLPNPASYSSLTRNLSCYASYTETPTNNAPTQSGESPTNSSTNVDVSGGTPDLYVVCSDTDGDKINATWWSNSTTSWVQFGNTNASFASGTNITQNNANFSTELTKYWWSVNISDGEGGWNNETYHFTTASNDTTPPNITINFAGNETDKGGPYWRPPGETTQLTGRYSDGYYANDSRQHEDGVYINVFVNDTESNVTNIWLQWLNRSAEQDIWTNWTYAIPIEGNYISSWDTAASGNAYPTGITTNGNYIWISDSGDDLVYQYYMNGTYTGTTWAITADGAASGITTNSTYFWISDIASDLVYKYYMNGTYTGTSWDIAASGNADCRAITTDNNYIWITDKEDDKVYKYDMDGTYISNWATAGDAYPSGIATDGNYFWVTHYDDELVYKYHIDGDYTNCSWDTTSENTGSWGITTDGYYFWVLDFDDNEVYKYEVSDFNTSGIIQTCEGYNYSFNIVANSSGGSNTTWWNKTGIGGSYTRIYVQLNCTAVDLSYRPLYFYNASYGLSDVEKADRLHPDQGAGAINNTGFLIDEIPTDIISERHNVFTAWWIAASICAESGQLNNIYLHDFIAFDSTKLDITFQKTRENVTDIFDGTDIGDWNKNDATTEINETIYGHTDSYYLNARLHTLPSSKNYTDNDFYEFLIKIGNATAEYPYVISNRSYTSFMIPNVPTDIWDGTDNSTDTDNDGLSDHMELNTVYGYSTNPFLEDTDYDGVTDYNETLSGSDPNNYTDTLAPSIIWIDITNASWDLGNVVMGSSTWTNETGKTFIADKDNCTVATDLKLQITSDGADWSAATSGNAPDTNIYRLNASIDTWSTEDQIVTASMTTISENIPANQNETFDLRFDAPTASSTGEQQSITVTATLVQH